MTPFFFKVGIIATLVATVLIIFGIIAFPSSAKADPPNGLKDYVRVFELEVHGDTVSCVAFGLGGTNQTAAITCDWENPR